VATIQCGNKVFENVQAVLFDKDGTLANSESFLKSLTQKRSRLVDARVPGVQEPLLLAFGLDGDRFNPSGLTAVGGRRDNEIAAAAYIAETGKNWFEALEIARSAFNDADSYMPRKADHTPVLTGCTELLRSLTAAGIKLGILSADITPNVQDFAERNELLPYLQLCLGEGQGLSKPDPAFFKSACDALGVPVSATLMVGDAELDLLMSRNAQAAGCIGATWGWTEPISLQNADAIATSPDQIRVL
jgi:phosphoglycolate phosphatase